MFATTMGFWSTTLLLAFWGFVHGLTPHGHSWLILLPLAMGGMKARELLRLAFAYCAGLIVAAAAEGALLGALFGLIPEGWHTGLLIAVGIVLFVVGITIVFRPLTVHHAIGHICGENCETDEERALLRTGTWGAMFTMGVMSMVVPCPSTVFVYPLIGALRNPALGALVFVLYACFTSLAVIAVAFGMVKARGLVERLEHSNYRHTVLRVSGLIIAAFGVWMAFKGD
jgi:nickel/cobalt transporter (NicO) family protein